MPTGTGYRRNMLLRGLCGEGTGAVVSWTESIFEAGKRRRMRRVQRIGSRQGKGGIEGDRIRSGPGLAQLELDRDAAVVVDVVDVGG